jgi:hypothetical protein
MDRAATPELIAQLAASGAFVVACVVLDASMMGITGAKLAADPRVSERLDQAWLEATTTIRREISRSYCAPSEHYAMQASRCW